jgi:hypothetical protein
MAHLVDVASKGAREMKKNNGRQLCRGKPNPTQTAHYTTTAQEKKEKKRVWVQRMQIASIAINKGKVVLRMHVATAENAATRLIHKVTFYHIHLLCEREERESELSALKQNVSLAHLLTRAHPATRSSGRRHNKIYTTNRLRSLRSGSL